jgi:DNA polymerase-3 subunit chi
LTQVDFYQIESDENSLLFACRLIEKVYRLGHQLHVHTTDEAESSRLDELLWSFKAEAFIPHDRFDPRSQAPIQISHEAEPVLHQDVLINLSPQIPPYFSRFSRVAEVVPQAADDRATARENFKYYKDRGYPLQYHKVGRR